MAKMNLNSFDQKQSEMATPVSPAAQPDNPDATAAVPAEKPLTEKLQSGEAVKTSLYLAPDMHKALKFMALEMSYQTDDEDRTHKLVRVNDLILLAIEDYLSSAKEN